MGNIRWGVVGALLLWLFACSRLDGDIKKIDTLVQAQGDLDKVDQQTLVVFDVDETLIKPTDAALQFLWKPAVFSKADVQWMTRLRAKLRSYLTAAYSSCPDQAFKKAWSQQLLKSSYVPIEPITVETIKKLQKRGIKVIALTACRAGRRGDIPALQQWRFDELKKLGIDFSDAFSFKEKWFDELPLNEGYHPMYYQGILMATYTIPKGRVLASFLDYCGWVPKKILFFDDRKDYVESVVQAMRERGISCRGYWYCAAIHQKAKLNRSLVQVQFDYLMQHGKMISEQEAVVILSGHNIRRVVHEEKQVIS